ncbi:MAG: threonine synthase [Longimicrobiales bacterium]|nr:threonine synthase [Longimicrobiales bacterium]
MLHPSRGGPAVSFLESVERGAPPGGGLYLLRDLPRLPAPPTTLGPSAADTAAWAAPLILPGVLPDAEMARLARAALDFPLPLRPLADGLSLLELFHGPTLAFKDVGARFLARLWVHVHDGAGGDRTVLVATSGDTGGAVAHACHGLPGLRVVVLFPAGRVSSVQRRQFTTLGGNVVALAVDGPFDRCQALVRSALADPHLPDRFLLTTANSVNPGRLVPQIFYYLHLARVCGWGRGGGHAAPVVVPSGNLGNLTAGVLARRVGAPLGPLVAACNANDVLPRFLADGRTRSRPTLATLSTAMDVGAPSNLERLEALLADDPALRDTLTAVSVSDADTRAALWWAHEEARVPVDPHTAVGIAAVRSGAVGEPTPATVLATAHPAKFPEVVAEACGGVGPSHPELERQRHRPERILELGGGGLAALARILESAPTVEEASDG